MLDRLKRASILGALGYTKEDATNAIIAVITRRVYVSSFNEGDRFESFSLEAKRFLGDSSYRKMLAKVGRVVRRNVFADANVFDAFAGLADDHSMALRTIRDKLEYGSDESLVLDDEVVDGFVSDIVGLLTRYVESGLLSNESSDNTPSDSPPVIPSVFEGFRNLGQHIGVTDLFPDIGEYLTPVDPERPWLSVV